MENKIDNNKLINDLKNKLKDLSVQQENINTEIIKLQNILTQLNERKNQNLGAMQNIVDILTNLIGSEEVLKFLNEINKK